MPEYTVTDFTVTHIYTEDEVQAINSKTSAVEQ